ncbi:hypothetical protein HW561_07405 [Rhodobacteraceae bacterium B1Z28]|uniref:DUF7742 domain-containing protein n=1 Tax=Ruegeria haliotis TaxID=2747601 RepID=A0ABX2PPR9_9RHOB|nr:hypothetical protein [Ruegeria haliotis]NVO55612.1 hypothetical protein [Ruegeria haliotis]
MRPVLHGDVSSAARALLAAPQPERDRLCIRMITEAELADVHVGQTGRLHPLYGNGSLMATARNRVLVDEPGFDDVQYCQCFELVLRHLVRFHINRKHS